MASERLRDIKAFEDTKAGVKGLVDAGVTTIPAIFRHLPDTIPVDASRLAIPVIDLARITSHRAELVAEVKAAAETVGFIQVVNHGVPGEVMSEMLAAVRSFNEEPAEARRPYHTRDTGRRVRYHSNYDLFRSPAANWRDTLVLDMAPTGPAPEEIPPSCRGVAVEFTREVQRLGGTLFELLSEALGLHPGYLEQDAGCLEGLTVVGHYYPASPQPHLTMGLARHTDPSILTVLLQDSVGGLQVLFRDGEQPVWVNVPTELGALIVNVGDLLQLLSNDRFKSVEHRVVSKSVTSRVSVASFFRLHGAAAAAKVCAPIKELLVAGSSPPRYRSATEAELIDHYRDKAPDASSTLDHFRV